MLIYTLPDNRQLTQGQAFELDGVRYGRSWLAKATPEMLSARGITVEELPPPEPQPPTVEDVIAERSRRLALGFDYDFGDERGIHHIGTTPQDMIGWDEVTKFANALLLAGDATSTFTILTNTGPVDVTAPEWNAILLAAAQFRQPIWLASFALQAMDPIPDDYADDKYWPSVEGPATPPTGMASIVPRYTVADLPEGTPGQVVFATDGRKSGEAEGQGTGVLCYYDGSGWKAADTGAAVSA